MYGRHASWSNDATVKHFTLQNMAPFRNVAMRPTNANKKQTNSSPITMSFSVMAGLVPATHVVQLAHDPNVLPIGRPQYAKRWCGWTTWMAGTSPR